MQNFKTYQEYLEWFSNNERQLENTRLVAEKLISTALDQAIVQHLPIISRIKSKESAREKLFAKAGAEPYLFTDIIGLRVVVLLDHDIDRASEAVAGIFDIDTANCIDKRRQEKVDSFGYRSLHLVASLGANRKGLPEYTNLCDYKFEIQIRTALQHTWAEIEHKRNYKGRYALPRDLQRRLMLLSGTLELVDSEFSRIAVEAENYLRNLEKDATKSDIDDLSYLAMKQVMESALHEHDRFCTLIFKPESHEMMRGELERFGVKNLGELKKMLDSDIARKVIEKTAKEDFLNGIGLLRDIMMCEDIERYFSHAFNKNFSIMEVGDLGYLVDISDRSDIRRIIESYGVDVV